MAVGSTFPAPSVPPPFPSSPPSSVPAVLKPGIVRVTRHEDTQATHTQVPHNVVLLRSGILSSCSVLFCLLCVRAPVGAGYVRLLRLLCLLACLLYVSAEIATSTKHILLVSLSLRGHVVPLARCVILTHPHIRDRHSLTHAHTTQALTHNTHRHTSMHTRTYCLSVSLSPLVWGVWGHRAYHPLSHTHRVMHPHHSHLGR